MHNDVQRIENYKATLVDSVSVPSFYQGIDPWLGSLLSNLLVTRPIGTKKKTKRGLEDLTIFYFKYTFQQYAIMG